MILERLRMLSRWPLSACLNYFTQTMTGKPPGRGNDLAKLANVFLCYPTLGIAPDLASIARLSNSFSPGDTIQFPLKELELLHNVLLHVSAMGYYLLKLEILYISLLYIKMSS